MKKYTFKNLLICLYICIVVYLCFGYFYDSPLKAMGVYEFINNYFGRSIFIIAIILIIDFFGLFIKCKKKKGIFNVRFVFLIILILTSTSIYFANEIGIPFEKVVARPEQLRELTEIGLYKYKIGLFCVFLLDWLFDKVMGFYIYVVGYILLGISLFFLFAKAVRISIMWVVKTIRKKQRERRERKLYEEQKRLEEYYRRIEEEKEIAKQKQLELEAQIEKERIIMESMSDEISDDELEEQDIDDVSEEIKDDENLDDSDKDNELETSHVDEGTETEDGELDQSKNSTDEVTSNDEETEEKLDEKFKEGDLDENSQTEDADSDVHRENETPQDLQSETEDVNEKDLEENDLEDKNIDNKESDGESDNDLENDKKNREFEHKEKDSSETQESETSTDEEVTSEEVEDELEKIKELAQEKEEKADDTSL